MTILRTARMNLLPLTRRVMARRIQTDSFTLSCELADGDAEIDFAPAWPGDILPMFPGSLASLPEGRDIVEGSFFAVSLADHVAVGALGTKGGPNAAGEQEIGYGFNPEFWGRGLATEAVIALTRHLLEQPGVTAVTAETAVPNARSARVLEKSGFIRTGTGWDEEDGDLITWKHDPSSA